MSLALATPFEDTTTFIPAQKSACKLVSAKRAVTTSSAPKTSLKRTETAETDELFQTDYLPADEVVEKAENLIQKHKSVLSQTRKGTKTFQQTFLSLTQIVQGEFLYAYTWDRSWYSRVAAKYPLEQVSFPNFDAVLAKLDDVLSYVEERQPYGYWYPTKRNGRVNKTSLAGFIASPMKSGNWWSPFLEIACTDAVTPRMYRDSLGKSVCKVLDGILESVWFQKDFSTMVKFYKGASDLKRWHQENAARLCAKSSENNYHLSSFGTLLERIKQCNEETGCVGPAFVGPWSSKWSVLKDWLNKVNGVEI